MPEVPAQVFTVVAIDHRFPDVAIEQAVLGRLGADVLDATTLESNRAADACADADAILVGPRLRFDTQRLSTLSRCRLIVRYGVGYDNIDVEAATARGISVAIVPDYCVEEVATHALGLILALNRQIPSLDRTVREGRWQIGDRPVMSRLSEATLGIIGFGRIGQALASRAIALDMTVLAADPVRPPRDIEACGARSATLEELLPVSDFVSIHAAKTPGMGPILDAHAIQQLKPTACVVNVARGGLVDEAALAEALVGGRIGGAALDVTDREPPAAGSAILSAPNVIFTPHAAWYSPTAVRELRQKAAEEVARVLGGGAALHAVNR